MRSIYLLFILSFCSVTLLASEGEKDLFPSARVSCGPWLQAVSETEFTVMWTTTVNSVVWVEVAPDDGTPFYAKPRPKYYQSHYGRRPIGTLHQVKISGLNPGTKYRYRIYQQAVLKDEGNKRVVLGEVFGNDILRNEPYSIKTLNKKASDCRFSVFNDIHERDSIFNLLAASIPKKETDFAIFNGDMLTQIETREQIEEGYLRSASKQFASDIPLFAVRGNHENRGSASYDFMSFFPSNNGLPYYVVQHGPAFVIFMDCGEDKPDSDIRFYGLSLTDQLREEQAEWLNKIIETDDFKEAAYKIVILHIPPISNGWYGAQEINRLFVPILNKANIDVMLSGHEHKIRVIDKGKQGNNFPVIINSNKHRLDVRVNKENGINIDFINTEQRIEKKIHIK